jgi:hypothetical protein
MGEREEGDDGMTTVDAVVLVSFLAALASIWYLARALHRRNEAVSKYRRALVHRIHELACHDIHLGGDGHWRWAALDQASYGEMMWSLKPLSAFDEKFAPYLMTEETR